MIHSSVKRWGNSPAVRIPATLMQALNLNIDDEVKIDLVDGKLIIEPVRKEPYLRLLNWSTTSRRKTSTRISTGESRKIRKSGNGKPIRTRYGRLIWVDFDPTKGSEQAGHRPAVVLSPFMYNNKTGMCLCVPCTTQSKGYPFEVVLSGQERDGVALADQVKSIAWRARGATKKGTVAPEELQLIKAKINVLIG